MTRTRFLPFPAIIAMGLLMSACDVPSSERTVLLPVTDDPTISIRVWFKTGSQCDPPGKEGLALLTATMLTEGATATRGYEEIMEALYPLAAGYGASVDKEMTVISGRVHRDNLEEYYPLFTDAILHPAFREDDFVRIKTDMRNGIEKSLRYANDEELGKAAFFDFVHAGTKYGHLDAGTISGLDAITLDDVRAFYTQWFTRDNFVLGLGGGYDNTIVRRLENDLRTLVEGRPQQPDPPAPAPIDGLEMLIVEKDCDATAISFGFPITVQRGDEDFFALALFNSWFGEHRNSSSHLYQVIREARGMNYGDYSYIEIFPNGGRRQMPPQNVARRQQLFEVWIRPVQHAHRHFALRAAMRELQRVVEDGMTQEQFDLTKRFLHKYALQYATTTSERLGMAMDSKFYGIDADYIALFRRKIAALTREQVNDAIRRHLQVANVKFAVVTSGAEAFRDALVANTPSPVVYDTPKPDDVLEEDTHISNHQLPFTTEKIRIVKVDEMFR
ncbi:MAG: pitrilysin family protein [Bacteroidota bacterium]|jgi:zinc protease|nr:pitrilysin family protein [Bacteroidota bacterium]